MSLTRRAAGLALAAWLLALASGCAIRGPLIEPSSKRVELDDTPFFPQRKHQCGPAALATVLGTSQVNVTPDELEPLVYLPEKHGSLQIELQAAPRKYGRLTYVIASELQAILQEIDAGRPVLVLHNYGLPFWPRWHYAVVMGYDAAGDRILLRSGTTRRQRLSSRNFMRAWDNGGRWALVVLRPGELPVEPNKERYLEAAAAFERVAQPEDSRLAFDAALERWPQEPVAWIGRGTANYRSGNLQSAAHDYAQALRLDSSQIGARNNLAMTLLELGCAREAREEIDKIDVAQLQGALREAVEDTWRQIEEKMPLPRGTEEGKNALSVGSCRLRPGMRLNCALTPRISWPAILPRAAPPAREVASSRRGPNAQRSCAGVWREYRKKC